MDEKSIITMPVFIVADKEAAKQRRERFHKEFEKLQGLPILVLGMNFEDEDREFWKRVATHVYEVKPYHVHITRAILNLLASHHGYDWVLWFEDDYVFRNDTGRPMMEEVLACRVRTWLWSSRRYICTAGKNRPLTFGHAKLVDNEGFIRFIEPGAEPWKTDKAWCTKFNMGDGIFSRVEDYFSALSEAKTTFPTDVYQRYMTIGEDCLLNVYLCKEHGLWIKKVHGIHHDGFRVPRDGDDKRLSLEARGVQKLDDKGRANLSSIRYQDSSVSPTAKIFAEKDYKLIEDTLADLPSIMEGIITSGVLV